MFEIIEEKELFVSERLQNICNGYDKIFCTVGNLDNIFRIVKHNCVIVCNGNDGCILPEGVNKQHVNPMANISFRLDYHINPDTMIPDNIKGIFAANVDVNHKKIIPIPRGLENFNQYAERNKKQTILDIMNREVPKEKLLYINHNINTNKIDRERPYQIFQNNNWCTIENGSNGLDFSGFLCKMRKHKFVLSPDGNGLDCHRTWEALYLGVIPIVQRHFFSEEFSKELPILIVDAWDNITEEFLNIKYEEMIERVWNFNLLKLSYWMERIVTL